MENPLMHHLKPSFKTEWFPLLLILLCGIMAAYLQGHLPAQVPTHWNISGQADDWSGPVFAAWFVPGILLLMYLVYLAIPYFDPKKERYGAFAKAYYGTRNLLLGFIFIIYLAISASGLGYHVSMDIIAPVLIGVLFVAIGYYLGSIKQNWFMGVRNPWTLESVSVWDKTQHLSARVMVFAGILIALVAVFPSERIKAGLFIVAILSIVLVPNIYSYRLYKKEKK